MARELFWLSDEQWAVVEPHLPTSASGAPRVDDRRVISGILFVLGTGCPWRDCPPEYGPPMTVYNRYNRWVGRRFWVSVLEALADRPANDQRMPIDLEDVKARSRPRGPTPPRRSRRIE